MTTLKRRLKYAFWVLNARFGWVWSLEAPQSLVVLITYYDPVRMEHINPQLRNILKCSFVDKLVISNHNPDVKIEDRVNITDSRLVFVNQENRRGCGHRWQVANELEPEYLIVVDDDVFLFPWQLAKLFRFLLHEPEIPHGLAGMLTQEGGRYQYLESQNKTVDFLCEVYAVTGKHLNRYQEIKNQVGQNDTIGQMIESAVDFMVVSQTGSHRPRIHEVGRIFRSTTFKEEGVAVHKGGRFAESMSTVSQALNELGSFSRL